MRKRTLFSSWAQAKGLGGAARAKERVDLELRSGLMAPVHLLGASGQTFQLDI
ncbi:MAG TPA: hypothetical protein VI750_10675 [Pyrinomonadaceae bacterium]|nr:hypothetical protein [Pyrinomonadaceae bacterium]